MRRLALVVALAGVAVSLMGASAAWGDTITATCTWGGQTHSHATRRRGITSALISSGAEPVTGQRLWLYARGH